MLVLERNQFILFHFLSLQDDYTSLETLAHLLQVSKSSIQTLLVDIDDVLKSELNLSLIHQVSKGIKMPNDQRLLLLKEQIICQPILDSYQADERRLFLFVTFLTQGKHITTSQLADKLLSSSRTISQDIAHLKGICKTKNLTLNYQKQTGYQVSGSLYTKNLLLIQLFSNLFENRIVFNFISIEDYLYDLFDKQVSLDVIQGMFELLKSQFSFIFNEFDLIKLLIFTLSSLLMAKNEKITKELDFSQHHSKSLAYLLDHFLEQLIDIFSYPMNDMLRRDFYTLLLSLPKIPNKQTFLEDYQFEIEILTDYLIQEMSKIEKIPFYLDNDLAAIMTDHLISAVKRIESDIQLCNPLRSEIISRYDHLLSKMKSIIAKQRVSILKQLNEDELAYLTLYFASSYEKIIHMVDDNCTCLLFSKLSNANLRMIQYELNALFHLNIIVVKNKSELEKQLNSRKIDFILTTEIYQGETDIPVVKLSTLLSQEDKQKIFALIIQHRKQTRQLAIPVKTNSSSHLLDIIAEPICLFQTSFTDVIMAISKAGQLLEENGYTNAVHKDLLVDKMKATESITNFILFPGILFPHIGISSTVFRPALSILTLEQPLVCQGCEIKCILTFCSMDRDVHKDALGELSRLLNKENIVEKLTNLQNFNDLKQLILE